MSRRNKEEIADNYYLEKFNTALCDISWAKACPIAAEGYTAKRYRKE